MYPKHVSKIYPKCVQSFAILTPLRSQAVAAKKKIEGDYQEMEMMLEAATHAKEEATKQLKKCQAHLKDYQVQGFKSWKNIKIKKNCR